MFGNMGNLADLMRNAGKIREQMEQAAEQIGRVEAEGSSGGGAVTVRANGRHEVLSVRIDPKIVADNDIELLEDLIAAAVNQALTRVREEAAKSMTGGLPIAGLGDLFSGGGPSGPGAGGGSPS